MKAKLDMIRVIHSVQRQPSRGFETIQPPATGARTGAMRSEARQPVCLYFREIWRSRGTLTCNICPCYLGKYPCPLHRVELIPHTCAVDAQRSAREETDKIPTCQLASERRRQGGPQNKAQVAKGRPKVRRVPPKRFRKGTGKYRPAAHAEQVHGCRQILGDLANAKFSTRLCVGHRIGRTGPALDEDQEREDEDVLASCYQGPIARIEGVFPAGSAHYYHVTLLFVWRCICFSLPF